MRYFGGKAKISNFIAEYINSMYAHILTYIEPFCGSCNVASKVNIENKILNDKHPYLIAMFKALQKGWIPLDEVTEEYYQKIKKEQDLMPHVSGFVGFACSFAGKYFGGYARDSKGKNSGNYALRGKNSVLKKMKNLMNAEFTNKDFTELNFKDSLFYCDPPYKNTTQYNKKMVGDFPYDDFISWVKEQSKNNIILVSEYKYNLPDGAKIVMEIPSRTSIRNKDRNVIDTVEILFTFNNLQNEM